MDWESAYINLDPAEALKADDARLCQELFNPFLDSFALKIKLMPKKMQLKLKIYLLNSCICRQFFNIVMAKINGTDLIPYLLIF